jgi:RNA polymerase sigma-70 factor (ECF subfamily)
MTSGGRQGPAERRIHLRLVSPAADDTRLEAELDAELVAMFLHDQPDAAAAVWDRYYPLVRQVLSRAIGPGADVEDLVQEVFIRLYRKLGTLRDPTALRAFVLAVAARVAKSELRGRWVRRWLHLSDDGEAPDHATDGVDLEARAALARFYGILDGLKPAHRTAFVLRHVQGLELVDVAAALGISLATVKRWLPRIARRVLALAGGDPLLAPYLLGAATQEDDHG